MNRRSISGLSGNDFSRQLAERNAELNSSGSKKFRSSAAPKGTKLGSGYQDRTQLRTSGEEDDKAVRVKALEEMVKLGQMDQSTFEKLRDEIVGGDIKDVHLVKGLDYKLLERARRGEDVLSGSVNSTSSQGQHFDNKNQPAPEPEVDVDEEFEKLEERQIQPMAKEEKSKKGEMAPPPPVAGKKRTRDDILKELKASRAAAAEKAKQSTLGPKFVKLGEKKERSRIERDERGREVLITVDDEGRVKRKVKKSTTEETYNGHMLLMPDKDAKPLGMEVAPVVEAPIEDDGDIFEDVGADYNPLGDMDDSDSVDSSDTEDKVPAKPPEPSPPPKPSESETLAVPPPPGKRRNYFGDADDDEEDSNAPPTNPLTDPTILAALKKASSINPIPSGSTNEEAAAKLERRKKMLESHDRDAEDMDFEFGSSRFGDQEDGEDKRVKLSAWGGDGDKDGGKEEGKAKRKRGAKKRKGDVNSAADVLKVMERRKAEGK